MGVPVNTFVQLLLFGHDDDGPLTGENTVLGFYLRHPLACTTIGKGKMWALWEGEKKGKKWRNHNNRTRVILYKI